MTQDKQNVQSEAEPIPTLLNTTDSLCSKEIAPKAISTMLNQGIVSYPGQCSGDFAHFEMLSINPLPWIINDKGLVTKIAQHVYAYLSQDL